MSADYAPALWLPTSHQGGWAFNPRYIILHGTAGGTSAQAIAQYFQGNSPPTSTHYVVGVDGTVAQCVSEREAAWGNGVLSAGHAPWWTGNPNAYTFSIEHCKPHSDNSDQLSPAQQAASFALVKHLCDRYNIPRRAADATGGITGHASIDPVNRAMCPGPYPWDALFAYLNGGTTTVINTTGLGPGDAAEAQSEHSAVALPEVYIGNQSVATLQNGTGLYWDGAQVHAYAGAAPAFKLLLDNRNALLLQLSQLKAQLAAAQAQQGDHQLLVQIKALVAGV